MKYLAIIASTIRSFGETQDDRRGNEDDTFNAIIGMWGEEAMGDGCFCMVFFCEYKKTSLGREAFLL